MSADEFICARCARQGPTCCQSCQIYVTPGDVGRIAAHTGQTDFVEFRAPDDPIYTNHADDPNWLRHVFRADGTRRILKRHADGDCTFLGPRGCTLPTEVRPLVCRLYPYDYTETGFKETLEAGCPVELVRVGLTLIDELGMNIVEAERWRQQLYAEIRAEDGHAHRADVRPA
jgi:uncharacterized protein